MTSPEESSLSSSDQRLLASALSRLERLRKQAAFDPNDLSSTPTLKQQQIFSDFGKFKQYWIRAGSQSGKSQTCSRVITWILTDTFPGWKKPENWGEEPLLAVVVGRTGKQIEESLIPKIRSYLEPNSYKEIRIGNMTQRIELSNGNRIIFQSLENPNVARERLQSYVAHLTWADELPPNLEIVREILVRTQARNGYALFSFTPTVVNVDIQRFVDGLQEPEARVYRFKMLDNPLYSDPARKEELLNRYKHLPEHVQKAIFEGDWMSSDDSVYYFDYRTMVEMPEGYSPMWRHVECVDPATQSKLGLTVWAESPNTGTWYCVMADYISGIFVPTEIIAAVKHKTSGMNIIRRISDSEATWYIHQAASMGIHYQATYKKHNRKQELIKQFQEKLGKQLRIAPHCTDLIDEIQNCRWSSQAEGKIINSSSFHLTDTGHYFADNIPKFENKVVFSGFDDWLYKQNEIRKVKKEKTMAAIQKRIRRKGF